MAQYTIDTSDFERFEKILEESPKKVLDLIKDFLQRGIAVYKRGVINNPWRIGMQGGGAPVATGNLRDTHGTMFNQLDAAIFPSLDDAPYAPYVHKERPWLDFVQESNEKEIQKLEKDLIDNITDIFV